MGTGSMHAIVRVTGHASPLIGEARLRGSCAQIRRDCPTCRYLANVRALRRREQPLHEEGQWRDLSLRCKCSCATLVGHPPLDSESSYAGARPGSAAGRLAHR